MDEDPPIRNITIFRANLKQNFISEFLDKDILKYVLVAKVIDERGQIEKGEGRGVFRDLLTEFWNVFFISATVGVSEKVPAIRHDFQGHEWEAIARILLYGYSREGYFPIQLSHAFVSLCLFGEHNISKAFLLESFKAFLSVSEQEVVNDVLGEALTQQMMMLLSS